MTIPSSTDTLTVLPSTLSAQNAPAMENAMPIVTNAAIRTPRKAQQTISTSARPSAALFCMTAIALRVAIVWSSASNRRRPEGSSHWFFSSM